MIMNSLRELGEWLFRGKGQKKKREPNPGFDRAPHVPCSAGMQWRCLQRALWGVIEGRGELGESGDPEASECEIMFCQEQQADQEQEACNARTVSCS